MHQHRRKQTWNFERNGLSLVRVIKAENMVTHSEIIQLVKGLSLSERLVLIETILKDIREDQALLAEPQSPQGVSSEPGIMNLAGIMTGEEAEIFYGAISESRKIDADEW